MLRREEAWREQGRDGSPVSSLVEKRREPVMRRGKHMAGKRFFRGGKCHIYGTEEKEGDGRDGRKGGLGQQLGLLLRGVWRSSSRWDVPVGVRGM